MHEFFLTTFFQNFEFFLAIKFRCGKIMSRKFRLIFNPTGPVGIKWICWEKTFLLEISNSEQIKQDSKFRFRLRYTGVSD